jgi:ChrB-like protein
MAGSAGSGPGTWVLLSYRLPREPSTPRITVWRKLKRLGVAQISDGLVALPADARTREHLDWLADEIIEAHGTASIWLAQPSSLATERELAATMATARAAEYAKIITDATAAAGHDQRTRQAQAHRLRVELRRIRRRDYFPPPERDRATAAVEALTDPMPAVTSTRAPTTPEEQPS